MTRLTKLKPIQGLFILVIVPIAFSVWGAEQALKLRPDGAGLIVKRSAPELRMDRVEIYVTGPKWDIDKTASLAELRKRKPENVLTNQGEISQLFTRLRSKEEKATNKKLRARGGYTYHLLAYNEREGTVTHIRVLDPGDKKRRPSAEVYPDATSSFSYLNDEIGPWLQANVQVNHVGRR